VERRLAGILKLNASTAHSITDPDQLRAELEKIRQRGYAIDDEEMAEGVFCIAMIFPTSEPMRNYALSFTLLKVRADAGRVEKLMKQLHLITSEFGRQAFGVINT